MTHDLELYLDNAATTKPLPEALQKILPMLEHGFGNPSSVHQLGRETRKVIEQAREQLATDFALPASAVTFTSGATESNAIVIYNALFHDLQPRGKRMLISAVEHPSIELLAEHFAQQGAIIERIPVDDGGTIKLCVAEELLDGDVGLVSCTAVANELGAIQPLAELGKLVKAKSPRALFHVDAVQAYTKIPLEWSRSMIDLITISGHKTHAVKGVGALLRTADILIKPLYRGGAQEQGLRPGTENTFAIACLGEAAPRVNRINSEQYSERYQYYQKFYDFLETLPNVSPYQPNNPSYYILGFFHDWAPGAVVVRFLEQEGVYASTGSTCSTNKTEASHMLKAIGCTDSTARNYVRLSFSLYNSLVGQERVFEAISIAMDKLNRAKSAL